MRTGWGLAVRQVVLNGDQFLAQLLLDGGADVNTRPSYEVPSINIAVKKSDIEIVQMRLEHDPHLKSTDTSGESLFFIARKQRNFTITQLLLDHGSR